MSFTIFAIVNVLICNINDMLFLAQSCTYDSENLQKTAHLSNNISTAYLLENSDIYRFQL